MTDIERVFVRFRGRTIGPLTPDKVKDMVRRGQVTRLHELSGDGLSWMKADEFGNFFPRAVASGDMAGDMMASAASVPPGEGGGSIAEDDGTVAPTPNDDATAQWYAHVNGEKQGPVSMDQMRLYAEAKILKKDSLVWKNGMDAWKTAAQALPELFGGKGASGGTVISASAAEESVADGGALSTEFGKHRALILALGVSLLVIGLIFLVGQVVALNQTGTGKRSDVMAAAVRISMSVVAAISGVLALQAATKMKTAAESSSPIATLIAVRAVNQFWMLSSIFVMVWLVILLLVIIVALATNIPVTNVLV